MWTNHKRLVKDATKILQVGPYVDRFELSFQVQTFRFMQMLFDDLPGYKGKSIQNEEFTYLLYYCWVSKEKQRQWFLVQML